VCLKAWGFGMETWSPRSPAFEIGAGSLVVATAWLVFYVVAAVGVVGPQMRPDIVTVNVSQNQQNLPSVKLHETTFGFSDVDEDD
jgi:hypothetical protein